MSALAGTYRPGLRRPVSYAADFIAATGITHPTQRQALHQLESDLLAPALLDRYDRAASRLKTWYPVVGGTAFTHQFNFVDPAAYALTFYETLAHSPAGGIEFNGVAYADTGLPMSALNTTLAGGGAYFYALTHSTSVGFEIGALSGGGILMLSLQDENARVISWSGSPYVSSALTVADTRGFFAASFDASAQQVSTYRNGNLASTPAATNGITPSLTGYLGTFNYNGTSFRPTDRHCGGAGYSLGLTPIQHAALYAAVQRFNTTLNRAV